jgi:hypothetical protein
MYYQIEPTRGHQVVVEMLQGYRGVLMVDDYAAYQTAVKLLPGVSIVLCWSHARRAFVEALNAYPECQQAIDLIGKLFEVERDLPNWHVIKDPRLRDAALQKIAEVRAAQSKPLTDELLLWARDQRGLPGSDRVHDEQLGGPDTFSRRAASTPQQQRRGARDARSGHRAQEPLWV